MPFIEYYGDIAASTIDGLAGEAVTLISRDGRFSDFATIAVVWKRFTRRDEFRNIVVDEHRSVKIKDKLPVKADIGDTVRTECDGKLYRIIDIIPDVTSTIRLVLAEVE